MSIFKVEIVKLPPFSKHPNADSLLVTQIYGYPVVFSSKDNFKEGDLVAYIPVDAVAPMTPQWTFLGDSPRSHRIKAKKLRGIFSMGLIVKAPEGAMIGDDVADKLGFTKYEEPEPLDPGCENEKDPGFIPCYTDIQGYRRYSHLIRDGESVIIMEKLHGCNFRACFHSETNRLWVGSRTSIKKMNTANLWWKAVFQHDLENKFKRFADKVFYGEVFGSNVQDLTYGAKKEELLFRIFDIYDITVGQFLNWETTQKIIENIGLLATPILFEGNWSADLLSLAEGKSIIANNVREGFVVRPKQERWNEEIGRVILKMIGEGYYLRKGSTTEFH